MWVQSLSLLSSPWVPLPSGQLYTAARKKTKDSCAKHVIKSDQPLPQCIADLIQDYIPVR